MKSVRNEKFYKFKILLIFSQIEIKYINRRKRVAKIILLANLLISIFGGTKMSTNVFGSFLRENRERAKVRLNELAKVLEISSVYLSDIELGRRNPPSDEKLALISEKLQITFEDLKEKSIQYRKKAEFDVSDSSSEKSQLALKMARVWKDISEEDAVKISKFLVDMKEG
ncbi:helix-turn-helix domain-containing protein (plasmid) [Leptospira sp. WS92.C1]